MNSKERVAAVLAHRVPDKVPYGEFAIDFDTIEKVLGRKTLYRNKARTQLAVWEGRYDELAECIVRDSEALARAIDQDIINAPILPGKDQPSPRKVDDTTWEFDDGRVMKYSSVTNDFTVVHWPERDYMPTEEEIAEAAGGPIFEDYRLVAVRNLVEKLGNEKFIVCGLPGDVGMPLFGGMANGLMYYLTDPGRMKAYLEAATAGAPKTDARYAALGCDAVLWGTDYAYNAGPFLSPATFREFILPYAKRRAEAVHALGLPVIQHACGNNWPIMDYFVEIGFDCYQSIQNSAGMDIRKLKDRYGSRIALWGGVGVENLVGGTPEDVARDVEYALRWGKPGGGYMFGASHSIAVGTKYENYMRMLEEFHKRRDY